MKDEPWRRTDIRSLDGSLALPKDDAYLDLQPMPTRLLTPLVGQEHGGQITLLPGGIKSEVSDEITEKGVVFSDLESASQNYPDIVSEKLGKIVSADEGKFAALTAAFGQNGVFVYVPRGVHLEQPLHSVLLSSQGGECVASEQDRLWRVGRGGQRGIGELQRLKR
ncbi:MAG: hypothetical protein ACK2T3_03630, partial [Candidatus Promineifilaceae bacterium]